MEEHQIDFPDRPVALLGQNQLGYSPQIFAVAFINFLAKNEAHQVGVLLDRSRFAQIAQLRPMIALSRLGRAAQLRQHQERASQFLRQKLHTARQLAHFLIPVFRAPADAHELQVIHHHQPQLLSRLLQPPQFGMHVHQIHAGRVVDVNRRFHHCVGGRAQLLPLRFVQVSGAEALAVHPRRAAQHARQQRLLRHLERKNRHRLEQPRRHMPADIQRQRGLAHRWPRRQNNQLARMQAAGHFVQLGKSCADALDPFTRIQKRVEAALVVLNHLQRSRESFIVARLAQLQQRLLRALQNLGRIVLRHQRPVHQLLRSHGDPPQRRLVADDLDVAVEIRNARQPVVERDQIAQPVDRLQFVVAQQFVGDSDAVDLLAALVQLRHARENAPMLLQREIVVGDGARDLDEPRAIQQNRTEDEPLGIDVGGKAFLEFYTGSGRHGSGIQSSNLP